jgi:hypothetical protein
MGLVRGWCTARAAMEGERVRRTAEQEWTSSDKEARFSAPAKEEMASKTPAALPSSLSSSLPRSSGGGYRI